MDVLINKNYYKIYEQFGDPKQRMIDALIAFRDGLIPVPNKSELFGLPQTNVKRIKLDCDELRNDFPPRTIRNFLHYFIDTEGYTILGWKIVRPNIDYNKYIIKLKAIRKTLEKFPNIKDYAEYACDILDEIDGLVEYYERKRIKSTNNPDTSN